MEVIEPKVYLEKNEKKKEPFTKSIITHTCVIEMNELYNSNVRLVLEKLLKSEFEGKCKEQGYIKPDTINIISYSCGLLADTTITIETTFECMIFNTFEGDVMDCIAESMTQSAGIQAKIKGEKTSPFIVLIPRDFHKDNPQFFEIQVGDSITVRTIKTNFILNDKIMYVIGQLV